METWDVDDVALIAIVVDGVGVGDGGGSHGSDGCVNSFIRQRTSTEIIIKISHLIIARCRKHNTRPQ